MIHLVGILWPSLGVSGINVVGKPMTIHFAIPTDTNIDLEHRLIIGIGIYLRIITQALLQYAMHSWKVGNKKIQ